MSAEKPNAFVYQTKVLTNYEGTQPVVGVTRAEHQDQAKAMAVRGMQYLIEWRQMQEDGLIPQPVRTDPSTTTVQQAVWEEGHSYPRYPKGNPHHPGSRGN